MLIFKIGLGALLGLALPGIPTERMVEVTIPAGTRFVGTLRQTISTETTPVGARATLRIDEPLEVEGGRLPAGMVVRGQVVEAKSGGRVSGSAEITLRFNRLLVEGQHYDIVAEPWQVTGKSESKSSLKKVIGGAVVGGVVGAIAGGTKEGLAIGALLGSGAAVASKGGNITLPAGQKLEVRLAEPVVVTVRSSNLIP
jgi:hypothetical protein